MSADYSSRRNGGVSLTLEILSDGFVGFAMYGDRAQLVDLDRWMARDM